MRDERYQELSLLIACALEDGVGADEIKDIVDIEVECLEEHRKEMAARDVTAAAAKGSANGE